MHHIIITQLEINQLHLMQNVLDTTRLPNPTMKFLLIFKPIDWQDRNCKVFYEILCISGTSPASFHLLLLAIIQTPPVLDLLLVQPLVRCIVCAYSAMRGTKLLHTQTPAFPWDKNGPKSSQGLFQSTHRVCQLLLN